MKVNRGSPVTDDMTPLGHHYGEWPRGMSRLSEAQIADSERPTNQMGREAGPHRSFIIVLVVS